ncbi:hypothetical protein [Lysobacter gummosus]|uniref:hypothetical protein n=1 Tax=Lysobacter gummosus TaxID=262324 RepID=UPI0036395D82
MSWLHESRWIPAFAGMTAGECAVAGPATSPHKPHPHTKTAPGNPRGCRCFNTIGDSHRRADQNVMLQVSILPVSKAALSFTRSFHTPLSASLDRFLV